jgi:hypothetical protein
LERLSVQGQEFHHVNAPSTLSWTSTSLDLASRHLNIWAGQKTSRDLN